MTFSSRLRTLLLVLAPALALAAPPAVPAKPSAPPDFWKHWSDGRSELDGYRLVQPRYGQKRNGHAVMIWVIEPFSRAKHVKSDHPEAPGADAPVVMKLNHVRKFQTGIYDYSLMTSVFSPVVIGATDLAAQTPLKVSFTSQEWCGNVFQQVTRTGSELDTRWFSYFESEGDGAQKLSTSTDLVFDDEIWIRVRELSGGPFAAGQYKLLPSLASVRLGHAAMVPGTLAVKRGEFGTTRVPAGSFETETWQLELTWGPKGSQHQARTVWVEKSYPHRIIAWEGDVPGFGNNEPARERGELTGSMRDAYWQHHDEGDEKLLEQLGLSPVH